MAGKMRKIIIVGLALCVTAMLHVPALAAGEPAFRIDTDDLNFKKGVSGNLVVSMENARGAEIVRIEGLENFEILSQNESTSITIAGNDSTYHADRHYTIMPKATGQLTLKAIIRYNGETYETNTLEVTVGEGSSGGGEAQSDLFVKTVLSHADAYLGEKLVVTYELYSRYSIESFGFTDYTSIDGVIAKDVPIDQLKAEYVYLDGVRYIKYEAKQLILDPIKAGTHTIPSFNLLVNVITDAGPGGILGGFFNRSQPVYLQTEEKELMVKPLPTEGRPDDFSGIVGELRLDGSYSRVSVKYGDSLSVGITASGNCNLDGLRRVFTGEVPGFTVYETHKSTAESVADYNYHVQKEFEAILVPEKNGVIDIMSVSISYFNPVTEKYERAEIPGATIEVTGDIPQAIGGGVGQQASIEAVNISQVNYADAGDGYLTIRIGKRVLFGVLIGIGVLLILAPSLIWMAARTRKQDSELKSLYRQMMASKDKNEIYALFNDMIKRCYKLSLKSSSQNAVRSSLLNAELAGQVTCIMDYMESNQEKECDYLKDKIKDVYRAILPNYKSMKRLQKDLTPI